MSWLLDALTRECERAEALQRSHDTEYDGEHYLTPSIYNNNDDDEDTHGRV